MRRRFVLVVCTLVAALAAAPGGAAACTSPAAVKSYHGHAFIGFHAHNSGPDQANAGTYTADLRRTLSSLKINLTHKQVIHNAKGTRVIFSGKASGGSASVDDTYDDSGDSQFSGDETHSGPLTNQPPNFGTATLFFDLKKCKYQLVVAFGVATTVSGTFDAGSQSTVSGSVYSDRNHIPQNLSVVGGDGPPAYHDCPGNPLASGHTCYQFGTGVIGLCNTSDVGTNHCPPPPVGNAHFIWSLKPKK